MPQKSIYPDQAEPAAQKSRGSAESLALRLIELAGGTGNISEAVHCTTRLRLRLRDSSRVDEARLSGMREVQGVFFRGEQLQIILGSAVVFRVYRQVVRILQDGGPGQQQAEEQPPVPIEPLSQSSHTGTFWTRFSFLPALLRRITHAVSFFSDIVVPIIPLFIGAGLLLGILSMIEVFGWASHDSVWFRTLALLTGSAFQVMAAMFGYHTAKRFGGTPPLGAVIGMVMTHSDLLRVTGLGGAPASAADVIMAPQFWYQGAVIPTILAVLLMTLIEKGLRRLLPSSTAGMLIPFLSLAIGGIIALLVIGPLTSRLSGSLSSMLAFMYSFGGMAFGLLLGGIYSLIVVSGLHHGIQAVEIGLITNPDISVNFLLPIWSMANIAQGAAGLAVYARTKDTALRQLALPASITAFFGITEPVIFGINLKLGRPFLGAAAGGAVGGAYVAFHQVAADSFGLTGIPMIAFIVQLGQMNLIHYIIGFLLAAVTAFVVTWFLDVNHTLPKEHESIGELT
ncbi:PTS transporter subunit EIIC [Paenibacillus sp. J22TS3]|uniref:PTS transporter subunit EIIC n=1 Tax=Paenibacillus sp. J22TS3 TaxID=2807192 RepID=UPI001B29272F|nr:PTS transporter subunit EIIC [Paenibacillus sp. J22TS3]GIP22323.1 negative regulator of SacY activity [Paenibacillus sp. J22TS3]